MAGLKSYSSTAGANTALFPENQRPSTVNNDARTVMADMASDYRDREWVEWGDGDGAGDGSADYSCQYLTETQITIVGGDYTDAYHVGRAFRITGTLTGTAYGTISASVYVATPSPLTQVTLTFASGALGSDTDLRIWLSVLRADGRALPIAAINGRAIDMEGQQLTGSTLVDYAEERESPISISGALTIDYGAGPVQYVQLFEDVTSVTITGWPANPKAGSLELVIQQDATGGWTITGWPAALEWLGDAVPDITGTAWAVDLVLIQSFDAGVHMIASASQGAFFSEAIG